MRFDVLTLFPEMFARFLDQGVMGRAIQRGDLTVELTNIRDQARGPHSVTDDRPYGGGSGMVMKAGPIVRSLKRVERVGTSRVILLTPQGRHFKQATAWELAELDQLVLICGRYEGVDERVRQGYVDMELSIGDYVLSGGETAAMVVMDAVGRLVPGVLGCEDSSREDSFEEHLLEHPHYTRPRVFEGREVPEVLLKGDHEKIRRWRRAQALTRTLDRRPDLLEKACLTKEDRGLLEGRVEKGAGQNAALYLGLVHYPVYNKNGDKIASAITTLDLHDLARLSATYGLKRYYVVTPLTDQRILAEKVVKHWTRGYGARYNRDRKEAVEAISVVGEIHEAVSAIEEETGKRPFIMATDASHQKEKEMRFPLARELLSGDRPVLLLLGTAWGLHRETFGQVDAVLEPIEGEGTYNHLSVRTAAAIILDRLFMSGKDI